MKISVKTVLLVAGLALLALAAAGAANSRSQRGSVSTAATVKVSDNAYSRSSITIKKNQSISFSWQGTRHKHSVTSDTSPATFSSPLQKGNASYSHTFSKTGTYSLFCKNHPDQMQLRVKVTK